MSNSSSNPEDALDEFIINPRRYQDRLAELLENVTHSSSLFTLTEGESNVRSVQFAQCVLDNFTTDFTFPAPPSLDDDFPSSRSAYGDFSPYSPPFDKKWMVVDDIHLSIRSVIRGLKKCKTVLQQVCGNINRMRTSGFCTGFVNVLVMDFYRPDVVNLHRLDIETVQEFLDLSCSFLEVETKPIVDMYQHGSEFSDRTRKMDDCLKKIRKALGWKFWPFGRPVQPVSNWISNLIAWANLIDLIVLLYCSAHLERFDQKYLQMDLDGLGIGFKSFDARKIDEIVLKRRSLACLDKYLGNQKVWVLQGKGNLFRSAPLDHFNGEDTHLSVSAYVEDLADIWGPLWPVKIEGLASIAAFKAGAGFLVPWPNNTAANKDGEMYYHWTEDLAELPERLTGFASSNIHEKQRLLIGGDNSDTLTERKLSTWDRPSQTKSEEPQVKLKIKPSCCYNVHKITQKLKDAHCLRMQGTERPRVYRDSETLSGTIGYIATFTGAITLKRSAGATVKDNIVSTWMPDNSNRNPAILECWYGVEVSACTGNARRRRLKDIFNLPAIRKHLDLCCSEWTTTDHGIGFSRVLADPDKRAFRRLWRDNPEWQLELQKLVYSCFDALRHTGADGNNQLSVFWMSDNDQQALVDIPAGLSSWTGILKNTECSCTMAVLSTSCLGVDSAWSRRLMASECRRERTYGYTLLETALVINKDAHLPKRLSYSKDCECGSKRCWDTHRLKRDDDLSLGQLGKIVVLEPLDNHAPILARWEYGVGTELRRAVEVVNANILKGSPMPHNWEVVDSNDERRRPRPPRLFLMSHALKKEGEWKAV